MTSPLTLVTFACSILAAPLGAQISVANPHQKFPAKDSGSPSTIAASTPIASTTALVGGSDSCTTPDAIVGQSTFAVSTLAATSGTPIGTCGSMTRDVWFAWTPTVTGIATVSTCGGVASGDTVLAAWPHTPGVCPTAGTQIVCNDDTCGLQSTINFPVASGTTYMLEFGVFAATAAYSGTFTTAVSIPPANDACATPIVIVGSGPHAFDTTVTSTGSEGQAEALCLFFGSTAIARDVWFTWVAPSTGIFALSLCGGASHDSKVAVYNGAGCPTGSAIACNDDSCALVSALCFFATAGNPYTIQLGSFFTAPGGIGTFVITAVPPLTACGPHDDGNSENTAGLGANGAFGWLTRFGAIGQTTGVLSIETCFGSPAFPGAYTPSGPVTVGVWDDPNDDGDPSDCVLLATATAAVSGGSVDTDVFQVITLGSPVTANDYFFVGAIVNHTSTEFPAPLDESSPSSSCEDTAWYFGDTSGTADLNVLTNNSQPPASIGAFGFPGHWLLRIACCTGAGPGIDFCPGDGTGTSCPCGNNSLGVAATRAGCLNSQATAGRLNGTGGALCPVAPGSASVSNDNVVLVGTGMTNASALYYQGTTQLSGGNGQLFGDGLRCVGGTVVRLGTKTNIGGMSQYPTGGDQPISIRGVVPPAGGTRMYQVWYRNAAVFCTAATFNLTNGYQIVWTP